MKKIILLTCSLLLAFTIDAQIITTVAGGGVGDGMSAIAASMSSPYSTAVDAFGDIYIADYNNSRIRKVSAATGIISTVAGNGMSGFSGDGTAATAAQISYPKGVAVDASGNIYIADYGNQRIRKVTAGTDIISTVAGNGTFGFSGDGTAATAAQISYPTGVAVDASGNIYIADLGNQRIRKVTAATGIISTVAGNGAYGFSGDGAAASAAQLDYPSGVAVDASGNIYIAEDGTRRIRKVSAATGIISTVAGNGTSGFYGDGTTATAAELDNPIGVAVDASGNIYIADMVNQRIRKVTVETGIISTVAGNGTYGFSGDGAAATAAQLRYPTGVAVDASGNIYIADIDNQRIRKVTVNTGIISTVAGNGASIYIGDGEAANSTQLYFPTGVAVDASGNIYISDQGNQRIRKVTAATGIISTVAGNGTYGFSGDGGVASAAQISFPSGVAVDAYGNIYIADQDNRRIRKVTVATGIISTVAGNGTSGFSGDGGVAIAAQISFPYGVAVDAYGNIYIADYDNNRIRKVTAGTGIISTVAGNGTSGFSGDGAAATAAQLSNPAGVAVDASGNIYISDLFNHCIRQVSATSGIISTVAGIGTYGFSGDGAAATAAQISYPSGVAVDASGNIYISEMYNNYSIRKISAASGIISTVAGNGTFGFSGDGGAASSAWLSYPGGIAIDISGNIYIADQGNNRIRKVTNPNIMAEPGSSIICALGNTSFSVAATDSNNTYQWQVFTGAGFTNIINTDVYSGVTTATLSIAGAPASMNRNSYVCLINDVLTSGIATLTVHALPTVNVFASDSTVCAGSAVTLNGLGASSYVWSGGMSDGVSFVPATTSTYTVIGTDANSCTNTATKTITVNLNSLPTVIASATDTILCAGGNTTLSGSGASSYVWSGGVSNGVSFVPTITTTYTVTGTDVNSCTNKATKTITVNPLPTLVVTASATTVCLGDSVTLNGTGASTYSWSGGINNGSAFIPMVTASYTLTGNNGICSNTAIANVTVTTTPTASISGQTNVLCYGNSTGTATVNASGGGSFTYNWSSGATSATATGLAAGTYACTVGNQCGTATQIVTITQPAEALGIGILLSANVSIADGNNGSATVTANGGTGAYTYSWLPTGGTTDSASGLTAGTYTVSITDTNGCFATVSVTITQPFGLSQIITTFAGNGMANYSGDGGAASLAGLSYPTGIAVDSSGNIYIADAGNHIIRKVTAGTGIISTVAGNGTVGFSGDGGAANTSQLNNPIGVAVDASGNIYISDYGNNRMRKVTASTGIISTVAGNGSVGFSGDGGPARSAQLSFPIGVSVDASGNIYIADWGNNRIRKITVSTGIISTVAGNGAAGFSGDGGSASTAQLNNPTGVALDASGNIYIADLVNQRIRKVTAGTDIISTVAGNGTYGFSGDGGAASAAQLKSPYGIALDASRNMYIADYYNHRIRKVTAATDIISTVAGNGTGGFSGDGGDANSAELNGPAGVVVDASGNLYISDWYNHRIRKVGNSSCPTVTSGISSQTNVLCNGNSTGTATVNASGGSSFTYNWSSVATSATAAGLTAGTYTCTIANQCGNTTTQIVTIIMNSLPSITITGITTICNGASTTLTASGASTYVWTNGPSTNVNTVSPTNNTTYTVTGTDANGCTNTATQTITVNPLPIVTAHSSLTTICTGSSITLSGGGANTYSWSNGVTDAQLFYPVATTEASFSQSASATYTVTGYDVNLCSNTSTISISFLPNPTLTISASSSTICEGESVTLIASGADSYVWSDGIINGIPFIPSTATTYTTSTMYSVTGTLDFHSNQHCSNTAFTTLTINSKPSASITANKTSINSGDSVFLTAHGSGNYLWSIGANSQVISVSPLTNTTYSLLVSNGICSNLATINITVTPLTSNFPTNGLVGWWPFTGNANDESGNGNNGTVSGVTPTLDRFGNPNNAYSFNGTSDFVSTNYPGILGSNQRSVSFWAKTAQAHWNGAMSAVAWGNNQVYPNQGSRFDCAFDYVVSGATIDLGDASITYLTPSPVFDNNWHHYVFQFDTAILNKVQVYQDTILLTTVGELFRGNTDINTLHNYNVFFGKIDQLNANQYFNGQLDDIGIWNRVLTFEEISSLFKVTNNFNFAITSQGSTTLCQGDTVRLSATEGMATYLWSTGATTSSIIATTAGIYSVSVLDQNGRTAQDSITINLTNTIIIPNKTAICKGENAILSTSGPDILGGNFIWITGQTTASISVSPLISTTYSLIFTNGSCFNTAIETITVNPLPTVGITASATSICSGTSITLTGTGANSFEWSPIYGLSQSIGDSVFVSPTANITYTVSGKDENGCTNTSTQTIKIRKAPVPGYPGIITPTAEISATIGNVCSIMGTDNNITYTIAEMKNTGSYLWTVPDNTSIVSGQGTPSIVVNFSNAFKSGDRINVKGVSVCGNEVSWNSRFINVVSKSPASPRVIVSSAPDICAFMGTDNTVNYSVAIVPNATSYSWTKPENSTIVSGQGTNTVAVKFAAGSSAINQISVSAVSGCGSSSVRNLVIAAPKPPVAPLAINGEKSVCAYLGKSTKYKIPPITRATSYLWSVPEGSQILSGQNESSITLGYDSSFASGTIKVQSVSGCGISTATAISINTKPKTPLIIDGFSEACLGTTMNYFIPFEEYLTAYNWTVTSGTGASLANENTNEVAVTWGPLKTGSIGVNVTGCGLSSDYKSMKVKKALCKMDANGNMVIDKNADEIGVLSVYPNPSQGNDITISLTGIEDNGEFAYINVFDVLGRCVYAHKIVYHSGVLEKIENQNFINGIYMVSVKIGENIYRQKIVVSQ